MSRRKAEIGRRPIGIQFTSQRGRLGVWLMHEVTYADGSVVVRSGRMLRGEDAASKGVYPALKVLDAIWHDIWVTLEEHERQGATKDATPKRKRR